MTINDAKAISSTMAVSIMCNLEEFQGPVIDAAKAIAKRIPELTKHKMSEAQFLVRCGIQDGKFVGIYYK